MESFEALQLEALLPEYYKRLFPFKTFFQWLRYGQDDYFRRREFALVVEGDIYIRYQSFDNQAELEKSIMSSRPSKIDIGAVFSDRPKDGRGRRDFHAEERELVFDIDLTDYDDIRTCCSEGKVCRKCWRFMVIAMEVLDAALAEDFGFKNRLWVFSGRRGVHCWVADKSARQLSEAGRSAVVDYLTVVSGGENKAKKVVPLNEFLHPSVKRAIDIIRPHFCVLLKEQGWLDCADQWTKVLSMISDEDKVRESVEKDFEHFQSPEVRWRAVELKEENMRLPEQSRYFAEEIMLQLAYPRLDVNVSKGLNHLLKSPFCVHPKTGLVSVPIDYATCQEFDVEKVPRIDALCAELRDISKEGDGDVAPNGVAPDSVSKRKPLDYKRTSLNKYVEVFQNFVKRIEC